MNSNLQNIVENLKALARHGGYVVFNHGEYFVQCSAEKGESIIYVDAVSEEQLAQLPAGSVHHFQRLEFKLNDWNPDNLFHRSYSLAFSNNSVEQIAADILDIFEQVYSIDPNESIAITDDIEYLYVIKEQEEQRKKWRRNSRKDWLIAGLFIVLVATAFYSFLYHQTGSPNNKQAVEVDELESLQNAEAEHQQVYANSSPTLSATALIELAQCNNLRCVELYMRDKGQQFIYAKKGEYAAKAQATIRDTLDKEWILPASTFYIATHPQESWKAAHTLHSKALADSLLQVFQQLGFRFADKHYYADVAGEGHRYVSEQYPGINLFVTSSFKPWYFRGLYANKITWPCYMFEVYKDE